MEENVTVEIMEEVVPTLTKQHNPNNNLVAGAAVGLGALALAGLAKLVLTKMKKTEPETDEEEVEETKEETEE